MFQYDVRLDTTCQVLPVIDVQQTLTAQLEPIVVRDVLLGKYHGPGPLHRVLVTTVIYWISAS